MASAAPSEEAWMIATCAPDNLPDLLLRLRMLCEPDRTYLYYYDETQLRASEKRAASSSRPGRRSQYVLRIRSEARKAVENDSAQCTFDLSLGLAGAAAKKSIVIERAVNRAISTGKVALRVRHRTTSGYASSQISFFEHCGLEITSGAKIYYGRMYAHYLGVFVNVYTTKLRAPDEPYHVEFSAKIVAPVDGDNNDASEDYDEQQVASRIARLVNALSKWLDGLPNDDAS